MTDAEKIRMAVEEDCYVGDVAPLLAREVERLKACVRLHHDQRGDDRCHLDDLKLYRDALGIGTDPYVAALPPKPDFLASCERFWARRQCPGTEGSASLPGCMTIAELTAELERFKAIPPAVRPDDAEPGET